MLRKLPGYFDNMVLALVLWLCLLPLLGLFIAPLLGLQVAFLIAAGLFIFAVIACWGICSWSIFTS